MPGDCNSSPRHIGRVGYTRRGAQREGSTKQEKAKACALALKTRTKTKLLLGRTTASDKAEAQDASAHQGEGGRLRNA